MAAAGPNVRSSHKGIQLAGREWGEFLPVCLIKGEKLSQITLGRLLCTSY